MDNSGLQRLIPIALVLIIIIVAVAAVISVGRSMFGGGDKSGETTVNVGQEALLNTAADRSVRMVVRGPLVADERFFSMTITAGPTARNMTTYEGYLDRQVESKDYPNSSRSYEQFVHALNRENLMQGQPFEGDANDVRGICPRGRLIQFEVRQASNIVSELWTTTCAGSRGSLKANTQRVQQLFQAQIPDFATLNSNISKRVSNSNN